MCHPISPPVAFIKFNGIKFEYFIKESLSAYCFANKNWFSIDGARC